MLFSKLKRFCFDENFGGMDRLVSFYAILWCNIYLPVYLSASEKVDYSDEFAQQGLKFFSFRVEPTQMTEEWKISVGVYSFLLKNFIWELKFIRKSPQELSMRAYDVQAMSY